MSIKRASLVGLALVILVMSALPGRASTTVPQTWQPGLNIFAYKYTVPLPVFGPVGAGNPAVLPRVNAVLHPFLTVKMKEIDQQVLPAAAGYGKTRVWAYEIYDSITNKLLAPANWPAVTVETQRYIPTQVKYVNELPSFGQTNAQGLTGTLQGLVTVDTSIHWANPLGDTGPMNCMPLPVSGPCVTPYGGPVPTVAHLHGGETYSNYDGGPEQWFTPDGLFGKDYRTKGTKIAGQATYYYDNFQEPGTLWFHDHALGATRTNVYSGLAAFYFIRAFGQEPVGLPKGPYEIEMAIQDRQFDVNGQLYFPDGAGDPNSNLNGTPPNPNLHAFWIPEFIGDVVVVNGAPWPYLQVEPRRYRFRLLDGSNARMYDLYFGNAPVYVIGKDGAYLQTPVPVSHVFFAPGQRYDIIVDFTGLQGQNITVTNAANVPYPSGLTPGSAGQEGMGEIMQFQVTAPLRGTDTSANPALGGIHRPSGSPLIQLTDGMGNLKSNINVALDRQVILKEAEGFVGGVQTGPEEVLVNNTKWDGLMSPLLASQFPTDGVSELPQVGATEVWEIINLTMDAHPMHTHLFQFQIIDRQAYSQDPVTGYPAAWAAAFAGKCIPSVDPLNPCPGFGPPIAYDAGFTKVINGKTIKVVGGNPFVDPYLIGAARPPAAEESGWNDTGIAYPGEVMRIAVRVAPTSAKIWQATPGRNLFKFNPTAGPGYVWHCHIVDHEDNEMMRPMKIKGIEQ